MRLKTDSGYITVNKRSRFARWLQGRLDTGVAWCGHERIKEAWEAAQPALEIPGSSAYAIGVAQAIGEIASKS